MIIIGAIFGSVLGGIQSQVFGRKIAMLTSVFAEFAGICCILSRKHYVLLLVGQFLTGFSGAIQSSVVPTYTSEISQPNFRKLSGSFYGLFQSLGGALLYLCTSLFQIRTSIIIIMSMTSLNLILLLLCPKSPSWLLSKGRDQDAFEVLKQIRGSREVAEEELERLKENRDKQAASIGGLQGEKRDYLWLLHSFRQKSFLTPLVVLIFLFLFAFNLTGATTLPIYLIVLLNNTGVATVFDPYWAASTITIVRTIVVVITSVIASKVKRRPFLIISGIICAIATFITSLSTYFYEYGYFEYIKVHFHILPWITYVSLVVMISAFSSGLFIVPFMLLGELLPSNLRGLGSGVVMLFTFAIWLLLVFLFPKILSTLGTYGTFFLIFGMDLFVVIWACCFVPETFGMTLENIESHYRNDAVVDEDDIS